MSIDPDRLSDALAVLAEVEELDIDHPDAVAVRRAVGRLFKQLKTERRRQRRAFVVANDARVDAATATAAPGRIDDETAGLPLLTATSGASAGELLRPRACYICKQRYTVVDAFYHYLCPTCAGDNHAHREARTDLTGKRALLTGGRAKIGMHIALRLLRDGAQTTITTRFPRDAQRRFSAMPDAARWVDRLEIVGIDLRDPSQVVDLADRIAARGHLDVLINNAAQTVRRTPEAYADLIAGEQEALEPGAGAVTALTAGRWSPTPEALTQLALVARSATPERIAAGTAVDAGGLRPDLAPTNSWVQAVEEVDPVELLEVQLCNETAPFILISRLRASLAAAPAGRSYVVNVSAMEGVFDRAYKGPGHPHTNMAKAAVNMLTRTSAREMFEKDGILMTSVDTGWITDERPTPDKLRHAAEGFHAPLDLVDGAARVYDPIVRGEAGEDLHGVFLKDYRTSPW